MAFRNCFIILSLVVLCVSSQENPKLDDSTGCQKYCQSSYTEIFGPGVDEDKLLACSRGCRFFTIARLILKEDDPTIEEAQNQCATDCEASYSDDNPSWIACTGGCDRQFRITSQQDQARELVAEEWHTATPVLQVKKVMAQVVGHFQVLRTSVMTYFLQDDNTLLAVQSKPQVIVEMLPRGEIQQSSSLEDSQLPSLRESGMSSSGAVVQRVALGRGRQYAYLLHLLLLLGAVSLTLLGLSYCLAIVRHQQRKTNKAANLSVVLQREPLKLVRPEDLTKLSLMEEDDQQAPPLPIKHDLALKQAEV